MSSNVGSMSIHFERGDRLFKRRWYSAALWEWQQHLPAARRDPADLARTFNAMSAALLEQGEDRQAYIKAELARDVASQLPADHPQQFYAHLNGALAASQCGDLRVAGTLAEAALRRSGKVPTDRRAQIMVMFGYLAINAEQYEVANSWLARAEELPQPGNEFGLRWAHRLNFAICRGVFGDCEVAEAAFAEALDLAGPGDAANVHVERGWMRLQHGDVAGAIADAREVVDGLLSCPAFLRLQDAADGLMLLSALARAHGNPELSSLLYTQGFAWLATAGWRARLRRSTRAVERTSCLLGRHLDAPKWAELVQLTEALAAGEHQGPSRPQRLGRAVHRVASQFGSHAAHDVLATAAVYLRMPSHHRSTAALPAQTLVRRIERGRHTYDTGVLTLLDFYDRAVAEEGQPYPAVLERMTREAGTSWDPRAVHRILLAHAS